MEQILDYELPMFKEPLEVLCRWIKERYTVHLKKDVEKLPPPWSTWEVMQNCRFTNVLRRHDKETKLVVNSTYENSELSMEEKILNSFLFRAYNKHETYKMLGYPRKKAPITWQEVLLQEEIVKTRKASNPNYVFFTSAFNTGGIKKTWAVSKDGAFNMTNMIESRPSLLWNHLIKNDIGAKILSCTTADEVGSVIRTVPGFGAVFLSFQVYVDITYIPNFPFTEDDWVLAGPGCKLGLNYLFGKEQIKEMPYSYEDLLYWVRDNISSILLDFGVDLKELMSDLPVEERRISLSNVENLFCEFSKTWKVLTGQGRIRQRYKGESVYALF